MTVNVYSQYFEADCIFNGSQRKAARVFLECESENGNVTYTATVTFFKHEAPEDFAISYDAAQSKTLFSGKGRRSKKREAVFIEEFRKTADDLANSINAKIFWEKPLGQPQYA